MKSRRHNWEMKQFSPRPLTTLTGCNHPLTADAVNQIIIGSQSE